MRKLIAVGLFLFVLRVDAQEPTAPVGTIHPSSALRNAPEAIPNIVGKYEGTFQNKDSQKRPMGMALVVNEQQPSGQFSGAVVMRGGSCAGQQLPMTGTLYPIGIARIKTGGGCRLQLLVTMTGSTIKGDMQGANPYEINLSK